MSNTEPEPIYESIQITVRHPAEGNSWFDKLFDILTATCIPLEDPDNAPDYYECPCGMISMGGFQGTLDACYDHERLTEKWAFDIRADDLKRILSIAADHLEADDQEAYERLRYGAYWHDDFNERYSEPEEFYMNGQLPEEEARWEDEGGQVS